MKEFKGTKGTFRKDIGFDIVSNDLLQCIIYSPEINTHNVAHVFGLSENECDANAKLIAAAPELLKTLIRILESNMLSVEGEELAEKAINKALGL